MANKYFTCQTDRSPILYSVGEEIVFHMAYKEEGQPSTAPRFQWEINCDFGKTEKGTASGESGELTLTAALDRPGFLFVTITATDDSGEPLPDAETYYGGAGVEIDKIESVTEKPPFYDAFWASCRAELHAVSPELIEKRELPEDPEHPNHFSYDVKIAAAGGRPVSGILTIPKDGKKRPCRVVYQGYGVKSAWHDFSDEENMLCINAHGIPNDEPDEYYTRLFEGPLRNYGFDAEENKSPHTCYFKYMMIRAAAALRFMMTLPEWDGKNLLVRGGSQGAVQSMHAAFLVPEVTELDIFVPWLSDIDAGKLGRISGWGNMESSAIHYFDTSLVARSIFAKTYIMAGLGDHTSPPSGITAMAHRLGGGAELTYIQGRSHTAAPPEATEYTVSISR